MKMTFFQFMLFGKEITFGDVMVLILLAFLSCFLIRVVKTFYDGKKAREALPDQSFEEALDELKLTVLPATVVSMRCGTELLGTKSVVSTKFFSVTFLVGGGEYKTLSVKEEIYLMLDEGMSGMLTLNEDGELYGFEAHFG